MIYFSPHPPVDVPGTTVYDHLFGSLDLEDFDQVAVTDGITALTYRELRSSVDAFAGALAARGVKPGDVVALHCPNGPAFVIAFHGILRAGATATTINALYSETEIANQLYDSAAGTYITVSALLPGALAGCALAGLPAERVIVLDSSEGHESLADLLADGCPAPQIDIEPAEALAVLPYSSGTTGKAKGVMLTHSNLVANLAQMAPVLPVNRDTIALAVLPFFHIYGMNVIMNLTLRQRGTVVTLPRFDLLPSLQLIEHFRVNFLYIAPPLAVVLAKHPAIDDYDLSTVETIVCGAAPLDEALGATVVSRLQARLLQGFGMTELSPMSHLTPYDDSDLSIGSIGLAVPNVEFRVVSPETGKDVPPAPGSRTLGGEMWVRGPGLMKGYLGNKAATAETITADGWLRTGDIVEVGAQGEVYVVDRLKELIKYKGYQVPPAELEAVLLRHPAVVDAAVVPFPDEASGEIPRAFVVPQPGSGATPEELMDFVARNVAPHKRIRLVEFIKAIPKSPSGKILRRELRHLPRS